MSSAAPERETRPLRRNGFCASKRELSGASRIWRSGWRRKADSCNRRAFERIEVWAVAERSSIGVRLHNFVFDEASPASNEVGNRGMDRGPWRWARQRLYRKDLASPSRPLSYAAATIKAA